VLNEIRDSNNGIRFTYILRPTEVHGIWEFVADADSNQNIPVLWKDYNNDGKLDEADENLWPGVRYDVETSSPRIFKEGLLHPVYEIGLQDQWGVFLSAAAPIFSENGRAIGALGVDMDIAGFHNVVLSDFKKWFWTFGGISILVLSIVFVSSQKYLLQKNRSP
jgi:hypothetical protein